MLDAHPEIAIPPETHFVPDLIKAARTATYRWDAPSRSWIVANCFGEFGPSVNPAPATA